MRVKHRKITEPRYLRTVTIILKSAIQSHLPICHSYRRSRWAESSAPLSWVLNKPCRRTACLSQNKGLFFRDYYHPEEQHFFFSQPQRLSTREDWQNQPAQGAELQSQQIAMKELISATNKNQTGDLMKAFRTSSDHSETSEICIKSVFFCIFECMCMESRCSIWKALLQGFGGAGKHVWVQRGTGGSHLCLQEFGSSPSYKDKCTHTK